MTNQAIVDTIVKRIVARFQLARILLFGSRARGTDNRWSDVDLFVVMDEVENKRRVAIVLMALIDYTKEPKRC
ncbi:MAG: nucleotidyltransferase domain-containing protein [Caldilineaceae bacterium]|nr:nucleotidyltransferase domain-containing protein [Caldilineaceae bacterium]MDE0463761.1 nucleotidyltransferase domain-containing protein [Caldilineaceae bacterium]